MSDPSKTAVPLVTVQNMHLVFKTRIHRAWSWRDAFVSVGRKPKHSEYFQADDRLHLIQGLDLNIYSGERVGVLGVNGTGKTSLCRCIAGMYRPTKGKVVTRGQVRGIFNAGIAFHPELTGRENARLLSVLMYPDRDDQDEIVAESLEFSELGRFVDVPYRHYSNGMQARLTLSVTSARPCDVLILDEIFDGADAFFREKISERILNMISQCGSVIFVSHSPEQLRRVCNRLLLLHQGQLIHDGDVETGLEVYARLGESFSGK